MKSIIIANITWNPNGWRNTYINRRAGHRYAKEAPGHECLNFKFDKSFDRNGLVHGYVQWTYPPKDFQPGGVVLFYTNDLQTGEGQIVGIYGDAKVLRDPISSRYQGFEQNILLSNIVAKECYSMLFPIQLSDIKYKKMLNTKRLVPQVGFRLVKDKDLIKNVIHDEIVALRRSGIRQEELKKLMSIYSYVTGEAYKEDTEDDDIKEQNEITGALQNPDRINEIIKDLNNFKPTEPELVKFQGKTYKRDNKTIAELKIIRHSKCQICNKQILKKDGSFYVEAAHIIPKCEKGPEAPHNILILCPNHHKEFDLGNKIISKHTKGIIEFTLNDLAFSIKLNF